MAETKNEQQPNSFKRKLGNTTYTVKVRFSKDTDKTFKDIVPPMPQDGFWMKLKCRGHGMYSGFFRWCS